MNAHLKWQWTMNRLFGNIKHCFGPALSACVSLISFPGPFDEGWSSGEICEMKGAGRSPDLLIWPPNSCSICTLSTEFCEGSCFMCKAHCVPWGPWKSIQQANQIHRALACVSISSDQANNAGKLHLQPFFQGLKSLEHLSGCTGNLCVDAFRVITFSQPCRLWYVWCN